jgi:hypothetical protein
MYSATYTDKAKIVLMVKGFWYISIIIVIKIMSLCQIMQLLYYVKKWRI